MTLQEASMKLFRISPFAAHSTAQRRSSPDTHLSQPQDGRRVNTTGIGESGVLPDSHFLHPSFAHWNYLHRS